MNGHIDYFASRGINSKTYDNYSIPQYLLASLPKDKSSNILDFGCGFGQTLMALRSLGYKNIRGSDIELKAIEFCREKGLAVEEGFPKVGEVDFIILSHVLEHIRKEDTIEFLIKLRKLLSNSGTIFICVPNAQSNTGCYWAYEDFTHQTLFTAGSLIYILRQAGFKEIRFVDQKCLLGLSMIKIVLKEFLLYVYKLRLIFWNKVTNSYFHDPSPLIFSYEIKVLALNN